MAYSRGFRYLACSFESIVIGGFRQTKDLQDESCHFSPLNELVGYFKFFV
ncbi:hypothetical protein J2TS4_59250 [Paenibacillus sp. J2TS4]|nr:hypothetical protein J2TS4_59250 [Paenibacillus sp. J2TS4]